MLQINQIDVVLNTFQGNLILGVSPDEQLLTIKLSPIETLYFLKTCIERGILGNEMIVENGKVVNYSIIQTLPY